MKEYLKNIQGRLVSGSSPFIIKKANKVTTITPRSFLKVGALISFKYLGRDYTAYIIETKRTATGLYISSRRNLLVTCLLVDLTQTSSQITLTTIYKRRKRSDYEVISDETYQLEDKLPKKYKSFFSNADRKVNFVLFGKENFRTFKIKNIQQLYNLQLKFNE